MRTLPDIEFDDDEPGTSRRSPYAKFGYAVLKLDSRIEREGALYAARMLGNSRVYRKVFGTASCMESDILSLLGLMTSDPILSPLAGNRMTSMSRVRPPGRE